MATTLAGGCQEKKAIWKMAVFQRIPTDTSSINGTSKKRELFLVLLQMALPRGVSLSDLVTRHSAGLDLTLFPLADIRQPY